MEHSLQVAISYGSWQGGAGESDGARPEADKQLVYKPEEAPLEALREYAVRSYGQFNTIR